MQEEDLIRVIKDFMKDKGFAENFYINASRYSAEKISDTTVSVDLYFTEEKFDKWKGNIPKI